MSRYIGSDMDWRDFLIEEFKILYSEAKTYQGSYNKLENASVAGTALVYGYIFQSDKVIPSLLWWIVPAFVMICGARCFAYYYILNFRLAIYLRKIERIIHEHADFGWQTYMSGRNDRLKNVGFNVFVWALLFIGTVLIGFFHQRVFGK